MILVDFFRKVKKFLRKKTKIELIVMSLNSPTKRINATFISVYCFVQHVGSIFVYHQFMIFFLVLSNHSFVNETSNLLGLGDLTSVVLGPYRLGLSGPINKPARSLVGGQSGPRLSLGSNKRVGLIALRNGQCTE